MTIPLLDVSFVLDCPEFNDNTLSVYGSSSEVNADGVAQSVGRWQAFNGVVVPASGRDLQRGGEGDRLESTINIYTRYPLSTGDADRSADRVQWGNGGPGVYEVISAQLWPYGQTFVHAVCKLAEPNPSKSTRSHGPGFFGP